MNKTICRKCGNIIYLTEHSHIKCDKCDNILEWDYKTESFVQNYKGYYLCYLIDKCNGNEGY